MKRGIAVLLIVVLCLCLCGCMGDHWEIGYWLKANRVTYVESESDSDADYVPYIQYQGETYFVGTRSLIFVPYQRYGMDQIKELFGEEFTLISWHFGIGMMMQYFSYGEDSPDFIVGYNSIFMKESFDYTLDVFIIENTSMEIVFSEAFGDTKINIADIEPEINYLYDKLRVSTTIDISKVGQEKQVITWHHKEHPSLQTQIWLYDVDGVYYMHIPRTDDAYQVSEKFLQMLTESGLLE